MAEGAFSFHCLICYEEFQPGYSADLYPVVLPCGHTYVCNVCAERLDKCMECRTPLFSTIPQRTPPTAAAAWPRHSVAAAPRTAPPQPPVKKRLPLPKNVVLLSLIEATEMTSRDIRQKFENSPRNTEEEQETTLLEIKDSNSTEEDEGEKIKAATSLAIGSAGTYAVATRDGLEIHTRRPSSQDDHDASTSLTDEDVDSAVSFYKGEDRSEKKENQLARVLYGDRLQVVSIDRGWAKLARGYGYVRADRNQLVKVGGFLDRACKFEALLRSLSIRRKELRIEQKRIDNQFIQLVNELQASLKDEEDLTVICANTFAVADQAIEEGDESAPATDENSRKGIATVPSIEERDENQFSMDLHKPHALSRQPTPPLQTNRFSCFANGVFDTDDERPDLLPTFSHPCINPISSLTAAADYSPSLFTSASHPSPRQMREGAMRWREREGRVENENGIDFRTGLSGHMALLSSHAYSHEYLDQPRSTTRTTRRTNKMSSHTGLSTPNPFRNGIFGAIFSSSSTSPRNDSTTNP